MTLVGGYKNYFAAFDTNYTFSDLQGDFLAGNTLSEQITAVVSSVRLGWRKKLGTAKLNFWVGETYWDTKNTITGNPRIPLLGPIYFEVQESTMKPFSTHIGTHIEITEHVQFLLDMGTNFSGLFCIAPAFMFRF
jgi:hypothetical protein